MIMNTSKLLLKYRFLGKRSLKTVGNIRHHTRLGVLGYHIWHITFGISHSESIPEFLPALQLLSDRYVLC